MAFNLQYQQIDIFDKMAFPLTNETGIDNGMTLLDWFAGQALAGILTNEQHSAGVLRGDNRNISTAAYKLAIEMMNSRRALMREKQEQEEAQRMQKEKQREEEDRMKNWRMTQNKD